MWDSSARWSSRELQDSGKEEMQAPMGFAIITDWQVIMESICPAAFDIDPLKFVDRSSGRGMVVGARSLAVGYVWKAEACIVFTEERSSRLKESFFGVKASVSSRPCHLSYVAVVSRTTITLRHQCGTRLCRSSRLRSECKRSPIPENKWETRIRVFSRGLTVQYLGKIISCSLCLCLEVDDGLSR